MESYRKRFQVVLEVFMNPVPAVVRVEEVSQTDYDVLFELVVNTPFLLLSRSKAMAQEASVQAVLQALQVFSGHPEKSSIDAANRWLQDFQHTARYS